MSDETQAVRLLAEIERLERAEAAEMTQTSELEVLETAGISGGPDDPDVITSSGAARQTSMTALLELLVTYDFDLGRTIVEISNDA